MLPKNILAIVFFFILASTTARGDVYQWQWIDPADPGQGKMQSRALCPDGRGVTAGPGVYWRGLNLTQAYLFQADLSRGFLNNTTLTNAYLAQANLSSLLVLGGWLDGADLTSIYAPKLYVDQVSLTGADLTGATLTNIRIEASSLDNANFTNANLSNSSINFSRLYGANFTGATISGVLLASATNYGLTASQIYSTGSYKNHDLQHLRLDRDNLIGWDFSGQNLTNATFYYSTLSSARFPNANLTNATLCPAPILVPVSGIRVSGQFVDSGPGTPRPQLSLLH